MKSKDIINRITDSFEGLSPKASWGETSLFYNPEKRLPNGIYFCTLKEKDGENDKASGLNREGVFRLSFALKKTVYEELFGDRPKRLPKGGVIQSPHDFTEANTLMPHPVYGWMSWVQILNPSSAKFEELLPMLADAHTTAKTKFSAKILKSR